MWLNTESVFLAITQHSFIGFHDERQKRLAQNKMTKW